MSIKIHEKRNNQIQEAWHSIPTSKVLEKLDTSTTGLTQNEAKNRLNLYGDNRLPGSLKHSAFVRFMLQFHNVLIYVLIGCSLITVWLGHWIDTFAILAVVIVNAVIGFFQEGKAKKNLWMRYA